MLVHVPMTRDIQDSYPSLELTVGEVQELRGSGEHLRGQLLGRRRGAPESGRHAPRTAVLQRGRGVGNSEILHYEYRVMSCV